jgi:hypothetical protein
MIRVSRSVYRPFPHPIECLGPITGYSAYRSLDTN